MHFIIFIAIIAVIYLIGENPILALLLGILFIALIIFIYEIIKLLELPKIPQLPRDARIDISIYKNILQDIHESFCNSDEDSIVLKVEACDVLGDARVSINDLHCIQMKCEYHIRSNDAFGFNMFCESMISKTEKYKTAAIIIKEGESLYGEPIEGGVVTVRILLATFLDIEDSNKYTNEVLKVLGEYTVNSDYNKRTVFEFKERKNYFMILM